MLWLRSCKAARRLAYSLGNLDQLFRTTYPGIRDESDRLLRELSELVPDVSRYDAGSASCRRTAKPANAE